MSEAKNLAIVFQPNEAILGEQGFVEKERKRLKYFILTREKPRPKYFILKKRRYNE